MRGPELWQSRKEPFTRERVDKIVSILVEGMTLLPGRLEAMGKVVAAERAGRGGPDVDRLRSWAELNAWAVGEPIAQMFVDSMCDMVQARLGDPERGHDAVLGLRGDKLAP